MKFLILLIVLTVFLMATVHGGVVPTDQMVTDKIPSPLVLNDICKHFCCKWQVNCDQYLKCEC